MKILLYINTKYQLSDKNLGGLESLNLKLFKELKKKKFNIFISKKITKNILNQHWDLIISSNDSRIFNKLKSKSNILWLHNKLQFEKAFRKKQLYSIFSNNINAIFVSRYLLKKTAKIYNFKTRKVIPNFLSTEFENQKNYYNKKPYFIWSVQRTKGLQEVINLWKNQIYPLNSKLKFIIFGIKKNYFKKNYIKNLLSYNIIIKGRVSKNQLINNYKKSMAMICLGFDETFCMNVIESYACGLPIISFGYSAVGELMNVKNSIKINDYSHLPKAINTIYNLNPSKRIILSTNCINYSKYFYFNNIYKKWFSYLKN